MIFRKLRHWFLKQGKLTTYITYAVGEIILVVLGILFALQINNWNQKRLDHNKTINYYERLVEDLDAIMERSTDLISSADRTLIAIQFALECLENKKIPDNREDEFYQAIVRFYRYNYMTSNLPTYEEMKSSGQLGLIQNEELRSKINEYLINIQSSTKIMETVGNSILNDQEIYDRYIRSYADPVSLELSFKYDFDKMKNDEEYINTFSRLGVHWRASKYFNNIIFNRSKELSKSIQLEIEKMK